MKKFDHTNTFPVFILKISFDKQFSIWKENTLFHIFLLINVQKKRQTQKLICVRQMTTTSL